MLTSPTRLAYLCIRVTFVSLFLDLFLGIFRPVILVVVCIVSDNFSHDRSPFDIVPTSNPVSSTLELSDSCLKGQLGGAELRSIIFLHSCLPPHFHPTLLFLSSVVGGPPDKLALATPQLIYPKLFCACLFLCNLPFFGYSSHYTNSLCQAVSLGGSSVVCFLL